MNAYKVQNQDILRVITEYPVVVENIVTGFPGITILNKFRQESGMFFIWVDCPNKEVTTKLGNLMRSIKVRELEEYVPESELPF